MSDWTKEPWTNQGAAVGDSEGNLVANLTKAGVPVADHTFPVRKANARRICAAVNFCAGVPLPAEGPGLDEVLGALRRLVACEGGKWNVERYARDRDEALEEARTLLAAILRTEKDKP